MSRKIIVTSVRLRCEKCGAPYVAHAGRGNWSVDYRYGRRTGLENHTPGSDDGFGIFALPSSQTCHCGVGFISEGFVLPNEKDQSPEENCAAQIRAQFAWIAFESQTAYDSILNTARALAGKTRTSREDKVYTRLGEALQTLSAAIAACQIDKEEV